MIINNRLKRLLIDTIDKKLKGEEDIDCSTVRCYECPYDINNNIIKHGSSCCTLNKEEVIKISCYHLSIRELKRSRCCEYIK